MNNRTTRILLCTLITFLLSVSLLAVPPTGPRPARSAEYSVHSNLWFEGTSTVRDWACKKAPVSGRLSGLPKAIDGPETLFEVLKTTPDTTLQPTLTFPVKKIRCEQGETMNGHLRNALEAKKYPDITFTVDSIAEQDLVNSPTKAVRVDVTGALTIKKTTKTVTVPLRASFNDTGSLVVNGSLPLDLTEYGVRPPTVMWTITVYDDITIHPNFTLKPE